MTDHLIDRFSPITPVVTASPVGDWIAFTTDASGRRWYVTHVNESGHATSMSRNAEHALRLNLRSKAVRAVALRDNSGVGRAS